MSSKMNYREIASKLNISPAALSLVVNHKPGVSEATRSNVIKQLNEMGLGYLIKKEEPEIPAAAKTICFLIYKRDGQILDQHPFFLLLLESIEKEAAKYGYNVMILTVDRREDADGGLSRLQEMNPSGVIIFATEMISEDILPFLNLNIPFVAMDNDFTAINCNTVSINNYMGTQQAIEYLVNKNHKHIGYLKSRVRISSFEERHLGYKTALEGYGLELSDNDIVTAGYTEEESYQDIKAYLETAPALPDAFVSDDDTISSGAIRAFSEKGIHVPEDISVMGFNNRPLCEATSPSMTTIDVAKSSLAAASVDAVMEAIKFWKEGEQPHRSKKIRIGTDLIERDSVAKI